MSRHVTVLELWAPPTSDGTFPSPPPSFGVPSLVRDADEVLRHGLALAEELGIDAHHARESVDSVRWLPEDLPRLFLEDAIEALLPFYASVRHVLAHSLCEGRPIGAGGARLAACELLEYDGAGRLRFRESQYRLDLLALRLEELCTLLTDALTRRLLVVEREASPA